MGSTSSTISNLSEALKCAEKCNCCEDNKKEIVILKNRIAKLERGESTNKNDTDLKAILQRLKILEKNSEALKIGIVETLHNFADIENTNREFTQAFQELYETIMPLIEYVGMIFEFLGGK
jgi:hypothetical protein